jgi:putrescine importer
MLIVSVFASALGAQLAVGRLLYGMGRSGALPQRFFGAIDSKHHVPRNNILFIGIIVLTGTFLLRFSLAVAMVNFGALVAFMGVNAAAFLRYYVRAPQKNVGNFIPPVLGFLICLALWLNLSPLAKLWGSVWMAVGITFGAWKTRGFRTPLSFEVPNEIDARNGCVQDQT